MFYMIVDARQQSALSIRLFNPAGHAVRGPLRSFADDHGRVELAPAHAEPGTLTWALTVERGATPSLRATGPAGPVTLDAKPESGARMALLQVRPTIESVRPDVTLGLDGHLAVLGAEGAPLPVLQGCPNPFVIADDDGLALTYFQPRDEFRLRILF